MAEEMEVKTTANAEQEAPAESMDDYSSELENSMRDIKVGDIVECTVTGVDEKEVSVDLNYFAPGIIRAQDYSADPSFSIKNDVKVGDTVKASVLKADDGRGNVLLSSRAASEALAWEEIGKMLAEKTETVLKVVDDVKGGVYGYLKGIRAFVPASHLALGFVEELSSFKGKEIPVRVITAEEDGNRKKLVCSSRDILRERREAEKAARVSNIQVGLITEGKVETIKPYGAFVALGDGIDGLLHISQIASDKRLKDPGEVLSVGDTVKVKVTQIKDGRISLSMRALNDEAAPAAAKPVEEEKVVLPKSEPLTTGLGALLKGIKL